MLNYFKFGPVVQEQMPFAKFNFKSGGHFVMQILVVGIIGTICVKLF